MTDETILVTGGACFIGRAVCAALLAQGCTVQVLDALIEQVHGCRGLPALLRDEVDFHHGDVRDSDAVAAALKGVDSVIHLAAEVGVGQSMYAVERYTSGNEVGTAVLLERMIGNPMRRIVTALSMSIDGEGRYVDTLGKVRDDAVRRSEDLRARRWDPIGDDGQPLQPVPTRESKARALASVYANGKYVTERLPLTIVDANGIEAVALRLWNVFGPGQALSNPYTGVLAISAARIANGAPPMIFEDGLQKRDFVHVNDVARAFVLALESGSAAGRVFNIASGQARDVLSVARDLAGAMNSDDAVDVTQKDPAGDIRHCLADNAQAKATLGFAPRSQTSQARHRAGRTTAGMGSAGDPRRRPRRHHRLVRGNQRNARTDADGTEPLTNARPHCPTRTRRRSPWPPCLSR